MLGAVIVAVIIVLVLPPLYFITGGILSAIMGWLLKRDAEAEHEGSELIDLNS